MQLGVALQNYESANRVLPPGTIEKQGPIHNKPEGYHMSWLVQLLPYIEEGNTFKHIDFSVGVYDKKNAAVRAIRIAVFACPSDCGPSRNGPIGTADFPSGPGGPISTDSLSSGSDGPIGTDSLSPGSDGRAPNQENPFPLGSWAVGNYAGCHHDVEAPIDVDNHGVMYLNSHVSQKDVTDGTAHTIYVGEKLGGEQDLGWMSGTRATLRNTGTLPDATSSSIRKAAAKGLPPDALAAANDLTVGGFASDHPGGCNFLFGDGRTLSIRKDVDLKVFRLLGNRADGQLLESGPTRSDW